MPELSKKGIRRITVHKDGTREVEEVQPDDPRIAPLADLIEDQLIMEIIAGQLGVPLDQIDREGLSRAAFSVAEEVDYHYTVLLRDGTRPTEQP